VQQTKLAVCQVLNAYWNLHFMMFSVVPHCCLFCREYG